ncbi:MAG TPA: DUF262 domain-containing protein [Rhizobacter sp.]
MDAETLATLHAKVRKLPHSKWHADYCSNGLERSLAQFAAEYGGVDLTPDFQRGHVWTLSQQERYIESVYRGTVSSSSMLIQFNAPHWENWDYQGDLPRQMQCVDGLQRLTAVRAFMADKIRAFGYLASELKGSPYDPHRPNVIVLRFAVHTMQTREELLQLYLDLNAGGTPHATSEIERVQSLLAHARDTRPSANATLDAPSP